MRDGIRVMKQWLDEVMHEGKEDEFEDEEDEEEDGGYVEHKNGTPKVLFFSQHLLSLFIF